MKLAAVNRNRFYSLACSVVMGLVLCSGSPFAVAQDMVPDFALLDVNTASSTHNQLVSPRDYLQQVSGWYFGTAT